MIFYINVCTKYLSQLIKNSVEKQQQKSLYQLPAVKNSGGPKDLWIQFYLKLAKKNPDSDFKPHTHFFKVSLQYFATRVADFSEEYEMVVIKKLLLDIPHNLMQKIKISKLVQVRKRNQQIELAKAQVTLVKTSKNVKLKLS